MAHALRDRATAWGIAALALAALLNLYGPRVEADAPAPVPAVPQSPPPLQPTFRGAQLWHWSGAQTLTDSEEHDLTALPTTAILQWLGSVDLVAGAPRFAARSGPVRGLAAVPRWSVIRIEVRCIPLLGTPAADPLATLVVQRLPTGSAGLQLDVDVPVRLLPAYGEFLALVRQRLPPGSGLSCTGLLSWLSSPELAAALAPVDWWVPQCYSTSVPKDPVTAVRLAGGGDAARVVARCEALQRPYRIGLPTFEQTTWWNPDRTLRNAAVSLALEDLLAAGLVPVAQPSTEERLLRFDIPTDTTVGPLRLLAGSTVLTGQPTVAGLAARMRAARAAAGPWFRGISLFRLAGDGDLPALSTTQLLLAERGAAAAPELAWSWSGASGAWTLTIANHGAEDLLALAEPTRLAVTGACDAPLEILSGGIRCVPALAGAPVAPSHADGLLVTVPFLRAGRAVTLPPLAIASAEAPACAPIAPRSTP